MKATRKCVYRSLINLGFTHPYVPNSTPRRIPSGRGLCDAAAESKAARALSSAKR
jgi:hypothetical protein